MPRVLDALRRFFDVRPGEGRAVTYTFLYIALAVASFLLAKPIRNGLFLAQYGPFKLVYVYVAVPVVLSVAVPLYTRIAARFGQRAVFTGSLVFFVLNVLAFWILLRFQPVAGLPALFYVWVNCYGIIAPVQAWSFANSVFDTRQARRLFGLIGSGASLGAILGGLLARELARRIGTVNLLLVLALLIALAAVVVNLAWRVRRPELADAAGSPRPATFRASLSLVRRSRYLTLLACMVFLVAIVTQWTQFQFSVAAEAFYGGDPDRLTRFFGTFNFWLGLVAFLIQLFATGPALRRFGLGAAILVLPVSLVAASGVIVLAPVLAAVVLANAVDQAFRFSIDKATFELLYLPLPSSVRTGVKGVIDVIVNRLGDGVGGLALGLATQGFSLWVVMLPGAGLGLRGLAAITGVLACLWVGAALALRRGYVGAITESIRQYRLDMERAAAPVLDRSAAEALVDTLAATDPNAILFALGQFEQEKHRSAHPAIRVLLGHPTARVRGRALALLNAAGDRAVLKTVEGLMRDSDLGVRTEALLFLAHHGRVDPLARLEALGEFEDFSIRAGMVAFLSQPGRLQNLDAAQVLLDAMVDDGGSPGRRARLEAARLLGRLPDEFGSALARLLRDPDTEVARAALESLGALRRRDLIGPAVDRLSDPALRDTARDTLVRLGPGALIALASRLADPDLPLEIRSELPEILALIGTPTAQRLLLENLLQSDVRLRLRVIGALNKLHAADGGIEVNQQAIEMVLMAEIMGHYRSYQILGSLGPALDEADPVAGALRASMQQEVERIFRLMSLRWPEFDMHSAYVGLTSGEPRVRANALEFLDNILKPQVRSLIVPLFDGQVSVRERVRLAERLLGTSVDTREDAIEALLASDDPWLRACGIYAIGMLGLHGLAHYLDRMAASPDPLLRQTVRAARARLAGEEPVDAEVAPGRAWPPQESMGVG